MAAAARSPGWRWRHYLLPFIFLVALIALSEAGKSKNYLLSQQYNPQDQPQRPSYYSPTGSTYSRYRRNFRSSDDRSGSHSGFPAFSSPLTSPRRTTYNARKGGPRSFGSSGGGSAAAFPGLGGPEAFLDPATTERSEPEEILDMQGFKFPGSGGFGNGFGGFSSGRARPTRGRKGGAKGGAKGRGGTDSSPAFPFRAAPESSPPLTFGEETPVKFPFTGASGAGFPGPTGAKFAGFPGLQVGSLPGHDVEGIPGFDGGASASFDFGGSSSSSSSGFRGIKGGVKGPGFGSGSTSYFESAPGGPAAGRSPFGFPSPSIPSFSGGLPSGGASGGSNPFGTAEFSSSGGTAGFPSPGKNFDIHNMFPQPIEAESPVVFPDNIPFDLDEIAKLFAEPPTTTAKPPLRVTSDEDIDKIFSNSRETEYDTEDFYSLFGEGAKKPASPTVRRGCISRPAAPSNGRTDCSTYSGCKAVCNRRYHFPGGEKRLFLECDEESGQWKVAGDAWETLPDCIPICSPPCQNNGICLAPDVCDCPDNWEGDNCEIPKTPTKKDCGDKPPTPMNSRILCSKDECMARCYEDYEFEDGVTRLTFECLDGEWVIPNSRWDETPDCKPVCDPACINGGRCIAPNVCECTQEFRGPICQYPISNCDPKKLGFNGGYNCTGEGMEFGCALWCPSGVDFVFPPADFYKCDYATSIWTPSPIPKCDYSFLSAMTPEPLGPTWGTFPPDFPFVINEFDPSSIPELPIKKSPGTCITWSGSHFKTFDGQIYSFDSSCPYTLVQDSVHSTFSINIRTSKGCEGSLCPKEIQMFLEDDEYVLQATESGHPSLAYRETSLAIPGQMNGVVSERVAHFVVVKVSELGITIKWDMQTLVIVEISEVLWNRTSGLCGRLDGIKENDWSYSDGVVEKKITNFLQAWQAKTLGDQCLDQPSVRSPCINYPSSSIADSFCDRLKTDPRFAVCQKVLDVTPYVSACRWDYCSCESANPETCACETFSAFSRECARAGVEIEDGWRSSDLCPMVCEQGKVYNPCMSAIQPRCGQPSDTVRPEFCVEGCDCPGELVLHKGYCIDPKDCPCTYRNKAYSAGDTIPNDCNSCTCMGGEWICTEIKCGSRCAVVGDPHYTTFDGRRYDFMGKCSYYLVQGQDFSIEAENTPCAGAISENMNFPASVMGQFPSCTKSVTIRLESTIIMLKQDREVTVNGVELQELPSWPRGAYIKEVSSLFVMVELENGLSIWWDGQTRVYIDAPAEFRGLTGGLCGTFTDNQRDDFLTPEGDVEQNPVAFANKWKISEKCPDQPLSEESRPCERHVQNKAVAEKYCAKLKSSLFSSCHLEVDVEPYHRDCLYDMCSCETKLDGCLCPILAAYSKECARKGIIVDWRAEVRECGIHCTGGQKYQVCGNSCAHTCLDLAMNPDCKRKCVEGCNCLEGFSLDNSGICVPVTECPCIYQSKEYKPGYEMMQEQPDGSYMICECYNVGWNCWEPSANDSLSVPPQISCPSEQNLVYTECMPDEEFTCQTMHLHTPLPELCRPGCVCEQGYVRDSESGKCIRHSQCPCHHGSRSYQEGDSITEECNTCVCEGGQWICSDTICPGICTAWGESHYKTFDGRMYEFHGTCDYLLAKAKSSKADSFEVTIQNVPCGTDGVTCAKSVTLRVGSGDSQEVVKFARGKTPPMKNMTRTIIREAGIFLFAEVTDMGLVLQWDRGTRAYLKLDPSWQGKVRGLCGNYNGDEQDDFMTPSGGSSEVSVRIFGDSWRLQNYCPDSYVVQDTCSLHPHRKVWAAEKCAILKSPTFAPCHSEVPVEPYIERCEFDACGCNTGGDCECLCTAIAAYGHECNIHGVYITWRTPHLCPMQCDESCEHYEPCIPTCPHETCDTLLDPSSPVCTQDVCVEGCAKDVCPPGQVHKSLTDLECVPISDCEKRCLEIDGEVYLEGDIISQDDCHTCTCSRKKKLCRGTPCETTPIIETTPRVTTPVPTTTTPFYHKVCNDGWSEWTSKDKPVIFRRNSDSESVPEKIEKSFNGRGWCERDQIVDIKCRSVGTHRPHTEQQGVQCSLETGLLCKGRDDADINDACWNYEVSFLCDCSISTVETTVGTTPLTPVTPPSIVTPPVPQVTAPVPMTCEEEGWSQWYNLHYPSIEGEFEEVSEIRQINSLCPDHYISEVECRTVKDGDMESVVTCDKTGARCRNNGGKQFCQDYEIRVKCECECQDGLGMEDFSIPNDRITASSIMQQDDKPHSARLNADWAWTAQAVDEFDTPAVQSEWLQVDLEEVKEITGVVTQGHPYFDQYVQSFAVQVSKTGAVWEDVKEEETTFAKQFRGNDDRSTPVTNLFPAPVFARYVRIIPINFHSAISLRLEIKGCDVVEEATLPEGLTTPLFPELPVVSECIHGWTDWMNTHTPGPADWDDKDDLHTLSSRYSFCSEQQIKDMQCQVVGLNQTYQAAGQVGIICNINSGLQCNDDLQTSQHCFDYEVRLFCDCGLSTTTSFAYSTVITTTPAPAKQCTIFDEQFKEHEDCRKFYECVRVSVFDSEYVEKECGPGTFYNPNTRVCDFEYNVLKIRKDCGKVTTPIPKIVVPTRSSVVTTSAPPAPCFGDYWTEWFNVTHPDEDDGDYETFDRIRALGLDICDDMYIKDIQCQFKKEVQSESYKGSYKGGRKSSRKGGRKDSSPSRYTSQLMDFKRSGDLDVQCNIEVGLQCDNFLQYAGNGQCQDYAIRVLCSCEATQETTVGVGSTTPYVDVRGSTIVTTPFPVVPVCPPPTSYVEKAVPCDNVCGYHRYQLQKVKECTRDDHYTGACTTCPPGQYLRDKSTCVPREDCNCILPNGMSAPPGRAFLIDECEVCQCSDNILVCSYICTTSTLEPMNVTDEPTFKCGDWSSWIGVEPSKLPLNKNLAEAVREQHPDMCKHPYKVECRRKIKGGGFSEWMLIGEESKKEEKVTCETRCLDNPTLPGCEDYEVRFHCYCSEFDIGLEGELTPPPPPIADTSTTPVPGSIEITTYSASHPTNVTPEWPLLNDVCVGSAEYKQCAMRCDRICIYYLEVLRANGHCLFEGDCAPGCVDRDQTYSCPDGFLMYNESQCVSVADCTCRLADGRAIPGGIWMDVSVCDQCTCQNNRLLCTKKQDCTETTLEPEIVPSMVPTVHVPLPETTTININDLIDTLHKCNHWTPFYGSKQRDEEGLTITPEVIKTRAHCKELTNATCREASTHIPAEDLEQTLICDPKVGLKCRDLDNTKDCYNYEIAFFCYCDEEEVTTIAPSISIGSTTTVAACDSWSPWINDVRPWQADGDTEYKTLQQLRDQYGFCREGHLAGIECVETASGNVPSDDGVTCNVRYGFRCANANQARGTCLDYKIRYYCSCEATTVTTTIMIPGFFTPPPTCDPDKYINLLQEVEDSAFSGTPARNHMYGPSRARLYKDDGSLTTGSWSPHSTGRDQYITVDLGSAVPVYGVEVAGNPLTRERVTSYSVHTSLDGTTWSAIPDDPDNPNSKPKAFNGPISASQPLRQIFDNPVEAHYIKIVPETWDRAIAVRLEVIGCELPTYAPSATTPGPICEEPMGLESGEMSFDQITVSSVLDDREGYYGKTNLPLNTNSKFARNAGAWVAQPKPDQYVRFNFMEPSKISGILTQGRSDSDDWVQSFTVRYSPDGKIWNTILNPDGSDKVFPGNYDRDSVVKTKFDRVIQAQYLEIRPQTWNNNIAMRVEVSGCFHPYPEVLSTEAPIPITLLPPPPYCDACPGLPEEFYDKCSPCSTGTFFDGQRCVAKAVCPCYDDGIRYEVGSLFESSNCEECECIIGGEGMPKCKEKKCPPCEDENDYSVITPLCSCICKPCSDGTKLCPSSNYCLNETKWCDGIEDCPDDELDCPSIIPIIPEGCPTKECPDPWVLKVQHTKGRCPRVTCELPPITTPMPCPIPHCPLQFDIVFTPKKPGEVCPTFKCVPPVTTMEPPTCPPPQCPDGYEVQESLDYETLSQSPSADAWCPHYQCIPPVTPTAPCPPPSCPQGYEVNYKDPSSLLDLCPEYDCTPIVTTTMCPPVECPEDLRVMYMENLDGSACPQYSCVQITTPFPTTTESPFPVCPPPAVPICGPNETIYTTTDKDDPCPRFACRSTEKVTPEEPKNIIPICSIVGKTINSFDKSSYQVEPCNHILAEDKNNKDWVISVHRNCSRDSDCDRYLKITQKQKQMILRPDLKIEWDGKTYTASQVQRIGTTTKDFTVSRVGDTLFYESQVHDVLVVWDINMNIKIEMGASLINKVDGLCGLYNGNGKDDKTKPDGTLATSTTDYGKSWSLDGDSCEPSKCSAPETSKAFQLCDMVQSKPFTECHSTVDPSPFLRTCVDEVCQCLQKGGDEEECRCQALNRYVTSCLEINPDASLSDWRVVSKCYKKCEPGEVYLDCFRGNCERSCENLHDKEACADRKKSCTSGCFCAHGLVRKGDKCVSPDLCRDCICEGYGDPHYKSFDRFNFTFNGECSYIAARDKNIRGQHAFQVITHNKECSRVPATVCTEAVTVLYDSYNLHISGDHGSTTVTLNGKIISTFPHRESWLALERPDASQVMAAIPAIEMEVTFFEDNHGFAIKIPSQLYFNKTEGLCGNCNYDDRDDLIANEKGLVESVDDFGQSWLNSGESWSCGVLDKKEQPCIPPRPENDPCLKMMDEDLFGKCHPLEDPVAYISACQLDACNSLNPQKTACHSIEAYARRCAELDVCLDWRSDELCPKTCPEGLEYKQCGPGCVRTCDNYEELEKSEDACPISPVDGCYCPDDMVLEDGVCVNVSYCVTCDTEGHRVGDVWKTDACTTCECSEHGSISCSTKTCPDDPICDDGYIVVEVPDTGDECCGPRKKCKVAPRENCPPPAKSEDDCGYGKISQVIEAPGKCPKYACVCMEPEDCPEATVPEGELNPGEEWVLDESGCCPRYVTTCSGECPVEECPEFYVITEQPKKEGQCCPTTTCELPKDACIYENRFKLDLAGFQRELTEDDEPEKKLYKVGSDWEDGLCLKCHCSLESSGIPHHQCKEQSCTTLDDHPDKGNYQLDMVEVAGQCCPSIVRTACIDDYEVIEVGSHLDDPLNGCRSVECVKTPEGKVEKIEQIFSCDESCSLGWVYEPSPLYPAQCCGTCVQVACVHEDQVKNVGETWLSPDLCTTYTCARDSKNQIQIQAVEKKCAEPTSEEREMYIYEVNESSDQCCSSFTRSACLMGGIPMQPGDAMQDPLDSCTSVTCELASDGNVTRKEKEITCDMVCSLGQTYMLSNNSNECCGKCVQTHCVDDGIAHSIGEQWDSDGDKCYEYSCETRDDVLTTVAFKKDCPYFDPECPEDEIYMDEDGCCRLCRVKRPVKSDCKPNAISPEETVGLFLLKARGVGTCKNPKPINGLNQCSGHCDSITYPVSQGGRRSSYVSNCFCCKPARLDKILVEMVCDNGYKFTRAYDNIAECECLRCEDGLAEYQGDDPSSVSDDTDYFQLPGLSKK